MERRYVGIDLHRRRSVVFTMDQAGEVLSAVRIPNDPAPCRSPCRSRPRSRRGVRGHAWLVLAGRPAHRQGYHLHLAHPLGMRGMTSHRRVKTDWKDATLLADLLRMGSLPDGWISPPALRELRELVGYRAKLVALRSGLKSQVQQ